MGFFGGVGGVEFCVMQSEPSQPEVEESLEVLLIAILWAAAHQEGATVASVSSPLFAGPDKHTCTHTHTHAHAHPQLVGILHFRGVIRRHLEWQLAVAAHPSGHRHRLIAGGCPLIFPSKIFGRDPKIICPAERTSMREGEGGRGEAGAASHCLKATC